MIKQSNIEKTEQVLVDNGIEPDEVQTVLQAIGYTLLDTELYPEDEEQEEKEPLTIDALERVMRGYGAVIRAIPMCMQSVHEVYHSDKYPGEIKYLKEYGREMLVVTKIPEHAGKFLIESAMHTSVAVRFNGKYFDTIEDAVRALTNGKIELPEYVEDRKPSIISEKTKESVSKQGMYIIKNNPRIEQPIRQIMSVIQNVTEMTDEVIKKLLYDAAVCYTDFCGKMANEDKRMLCDLITEICEDTGHDIRFEWDPVTEWSGPLYVSGIVAEKEFNHCPMSRIKELFGEESSKGDRE